MSKSSIKWPLRRSRSSDSVVYQRLTSSSNSPHAKDDEKNERLAKISKKSKMKNYGGDEDVFEDSKNSNLTFNVYPNSNPCNCLNDSCACSNFQNFSNLASNGSSKRKMSITVLDSGEHCHDDESQRAIDKKARKKLWLASLLCVLFMIAESVGGILAGSLAVATDAAHLLTDFAGFMISLFALYISERPATKRLSYGYHRAEVIGALTSVLLIWVVTGILVYMAVQRLITPVFEIDATIMLITSGVGLIVNIIMGCTLHQHAHTHGHSHNSVEKEAEEGHVSHHAHHVSPNTHRQNINVRAAFIHVVGDFIQSVGVFSAALLIYFKPEWTIVDPICTFLFSILVLGTTYAIMKDTLVVLMEGIPKGIDFNDVRETLLKVEGVCKVHNLRIWSLSMDRMALSAHLAIEGTASSGAEILRKSSQMVKTKYGFSEVTIQIEDFSEKMQDCVKCQELN